MNDWTITTVIAKLGDFKEFVNQRFTDNDKAVQAALVSQEKAVAAALAAAEKAVLKAETAADKRFDAVNEFRATLTDQTNTFLPRPEYNAQHKALEEKVDVLTERVNSMTGRSSGLQASWGYLVAFVSIVIVIANYLTSHQ